MYKGRRYRRRKKQKPIMLLVSMILVLTVAVGGTLAYLVTQTGDVKNTFTVQEVPIEIEETFNNNVKSSVTIKNVSDDDSSWLANDPGTPAYIRAAVVANWVNPDNPNEVYGQAPAESNYAFELGDGWFEEGGYYYYKDIVEPNDSTENLFKDGCTLSGTAPDEDYVLSVEILAQSIQARGTTSDGTPAVKDAWGIDLDADNGKLIDPSSN